VARLVSSITTAAAISLLAQQQAQTPQVPPFRSGIDIVRLDVSVLDKDRKPVRDLKAEDFAITVDGAVQPIVAFDAIVLPPREIPTAPWMTGVAPDVRTNALGEPRLFVIIMDDATTPTDPDMVATAKKIAHGIIDQMSASDLAAVVFTMNNRHAQDFTSDRQLLRAAVDQFSMGMRGNPLAARYSQKTLEGVLKVLHERPQGRNAIMLMSASPISSEEVSETGLEMRRMADMITDLGAIERAARIAPVPIYGFNIAGLLAPNAAAARNPSGAAAGYAERPYTDRDARAANNIFLTLAEMSGGRAIVDVNEPERFVPAVFEEMSAYYLVAYRAAYPVADGKARRLQIRVERPGVTVLPSERLLPADRAKTRTATALPPLLKAVADLTPASELPVAVTAAPFVLPHDSRAKGPVTGLLTTVYLRRPAPANLASDQIEVLAKLFTPEGQAVGTGRQTAALTLRPTGRDAELEILTAIPLKPGRYNLRVSARSADLEKTGSVYTDVIVPDFAREKLSLSGVVIAAAPTPAAAPKDAFAGIIPVVPTTTRGFDRTDNARAFLRMYQGGTQPAVPVDVTVRLTDAQGAEVSVRRDRVTADAFAAARSADYTYEIPLRTLKPGAHLLTIEATAGPFTSRRDVRFSVR
jgi:VWFA-related protein